MTEHTVSHTDKTTGSRAGVVTVEVLGALLLVFLDQYTKVLAVQALKGKPPIELLPGVLELYYLENTGAAFSLFRNAQWFFILVAAAAIVAIVALLHRIPATRRFAPLHVLLVLIASGACGNLIDRLRFSYVRDFIYFSLIDFPVFNVADIYVTVSTILLVLLVVFRYKDKDFEEIRSRQS